MHVWVNNSYDNWIKILCFGTSGENSFCYHTVIKPTQICTTGSLGRKTEHKAELEAKVVSGRSMALNKAHKIDKRIRTPLINLLLSDSYVMLELFKAEANSAAHLIMLQSTNTSRISFIFFLHQIYICCSINGAINWAIDETRIKMLWESLSPIHDRTIWLLGGQR